MSKAMLCGQTPKDACSLEMTMEGSPLFRLFLDQVSTRMGVLSMSVTWWKELSGKASKDFLETGWKLLSAMSNMLT